ncbi:hypothetical protein KUCAC02_032706, partial [Chaenocephalus aceratus]
PRDVGGSEPIHHQSRRVYREVVRECIGLSNNTSASRLPPSWSLADDQTLPPLKCKRGTSEKEGNECRAAGAVNEDEVADDSPLKGGGREEDSPCDCMPKRSSPMSCSRPDTRAEQPRGSRKTLHRLAETLQAAE